MSRKYLYSFNSVFKKVQKDQKVQKYDGKMLTNN